MMTGLLTGMVFAGLHRATEALVQPVKIERVDSGPDGIIELRLASGMLVSCTIHVEPVA